MNDQSRRELENMRRNLAVLDKVKKERNQWRECAKELAYWKGFEGACKPEGLTQVSRLALAHFDTFEKGENR